MNGESDEVTVHASMYVTDTVKVDLQVELVGITRLVWHMGVGERGWVWREHLVMYN